MIHLFIHLPAYRQLSRLRKDALDDVVEELERLPEGTESTLRPIGEGAWVIQLGKFKKTGSRSSQLRITAFCEKLLELRIYFDERENRLQGYNLIIDYIDDPGSVSLLEHFKNLILISPEDRNVWVSAAAANSMGELFTLADAAGSMKIVTGLLPGDLSRELPTASFCVRQEFSAEIVDAIRSIYLDGPEARLICVYSGNAGSFRQTTGHAMEVLAASVDNADWTIVDGSKAGPGPIAPVLRSMSYAIIEDLPEYLSTSEMDIWQTQYAIADRYGPSLSFSDVPQVDGYTLYALYLSAYIRRMEELFLPPVWVCDGFDNLESEAQEICVRVIENFLKLSLPRLIPVIVMKSAKLPEILAGVPRREITVSDLAREELAEKIGVYRGETSTDDTGREADRLLRSSKGSLTACLHSMLCAQRAVSRVPGISIHPTESLVKSLDGDQQIVLYLLSVADQAVGRSLLFSFLETEGFDLASLKGYAELFSEYLLYPAPDEAQNDHIAKYIYSLLRSRADDIIRRLSHFAADGLSEGKLLLDRRTIHFFLAAEHPLYVHLASVYISWLLSNGRVKDAGALLAEIESNAQESDVVIPLQAMRLRTLVFQSNPAEASRLYSELRKTTSRKSAIEGVKRLESARYLYGKGSFPDALQEAKEALMLFQEQNSENEVYACTYVGLAMLGQSRLDESEAYFNIAEERTASSETPSAVFNGMCSAATQYLVGNITRAKRIAEKWLEISGQQGMRSYQTILLFFMMRFHFDLGQYEICIQMCLQGLTLGKLYSSSSSIVFGRWLRRALAYSGNFSEALAGLDTTKGNLEDIYFAAECFFLQESYDQAVFCLEPVIGAKYQMNKSLYPAEMVRWDSGYSMLEDRAIPGDSHSPVLSRLIRSFYSYLSCVEGISESGLDDLARLNREERLSNIDPNNGVYLYYYSVALRRNSGAGDLDRLTALSKALKFVQERAAKMDDTGDKRLFLNSNFWNRRIFSDARSAKLL